MPSCAAEAPRPFRRAARTCASRSPVTGIHRGPGRVPSDPPHPGGRAVVRGGPCGFAPASHIAHRGGKAREGEYEAARAGQYQEADGLARPGRIRRHVRQGRTGGGLRPSPCPSCETRSLCTSPRRDTRRTVRPGDEMLMLPSTTVGTPPVRRPPSCTGSPGRSPTEPLSVTAHGARPVRCLAAAPFAIWHVPLLVAALADRWGTAPEPPGGRTVWAEVAPRPRTPRS